MSSSTIAPAKPLAEQLRTVEAEVDLLASMSPTSATVEEMAGLLVELETLQNRFAGVAARWAAEFDASGGPEDHGAPTLATWSRRELRTTVAETRRRTRRAFALEALPSTRSALNEGIIGLAHVDAIATGVHQLGKQIIADVELILLDVATDCDADAVRAALRKVRDTLDPDAADAAYVQAMEKSDLTVSPVGDAYVINGLVDAETGVMFREALYSLARPIAVDDPRTSGQRRVDALHDLCKAVLEHGLPADRGLRPHLLVTVPAERLATAGTDRPSVGEPAELVGHGPIPDSLLTRLGCDAMVTPVVADGDGNVLDVGRTRRLATLKQRLAITVAQGGVCANPGCARTRLEIHHFDSWANGGATDMNNLGGFCTRCHHLIHQGLLLITRDPSTGQRQYRTRHRHRLHDRPRATRERIRRYLNPRVHR